MPGPLRKLRPSIGRLPGPSRRHLNRALLGVAVALVVGNLVILGGSAVAKASARSSEALAGVGNFRVVDDRLLRGDAPTPEGYRSLARRGVTTVVDLRAERDLGVPDQILSELGIERVHLPIRDGQTPSAADVQRFLEVMSSSDGLVYLHCGAGVGRTGSMTAAYLVETGQRSGLGALRANLAVGPPSLEQIVYAASLEGDRPPSQPPAAIEAVSRFLDAPRRMWSRLRA